MNGTARSKTPKHKRVVVLGAGVAGAAVASRLGIGGVQVDLVERQGTIGGHAAEMACKATDVCLRCNVCLACDILKKLPTVPNVRIHRSTDLIGLRPGRKGARYTAVLRHKPDFITSDLCIRCGLCVDVCPEKCIRVPSAAIADGIPVIDLSSCRRTARRKCTKCADACPVKAIDLDQEGSTSELLVDAVVLATGYEAYDPSRDGPYGYGRVANVITGLEAEHQLAKQGSITRPSDGQSPKRIAFIQCVGSRSEEAHRRPEDTDYCSVVCCPYALRIAKLIKHQNDNSAITVFYMDIQSFGKQFDEFYHQCRDKMTFVRSRPYEIAEGTDSAVRIRYVSDPYVSGQKSRVLEEEFDLAILAVGICPTDDARELADKLRVAVDDQGFFGYKGGVGPADLRRKHIFAAGACESPKDIASSIAQAEAVSAAILGEV